MNALFGFMVPMNWKDLKSNPPTKDCHIAITDGFGYYAVAYYLVGEQAITEPQPYEGVWDKSERMAVADMRDEMLYINLEEITR